MHARLAERVAFSRLNRLGRYIELLGDFLGFHTLTIELHDLLLARRQSCVELRSAYDAGILAFSFKRTTDLLKSEPASPVYILFLVEAPEIAADEPMTYEVTFARLLQ